MAWPKITVVTPSYNQAEFLEATLKSVLEQAYPNLEYIVIDGGSTDGSVEILERYSHHFSYWVSETDRGQTDALIKGFARASGDILCWLNSDDLFEPWTLTEVATFFQQQGSARVVYGDATVIDRDGRLVRFKKEHSFNRFIWMYDHNYINQTSTFWCRSIYEEVGGLDPAFDLAMDADLWIRFASVAPLYHVRRRWSRFRLYRAQKNQRLRQSSDQEDLTIRRRYLGREPSWSRKMKWVAAKGTRVAWKLMTGCYW
jgi:glycosyltransferase involved in cell wall biosynthesis